MAEYVVRLLVKKEKLGNTFEAGAEVIAYEDGIGVVRIRECSMITLEINEYEMVLDERDFYRLLFYVEA